MNNYIEEIKRLESRLLQLKQEAARSEEISRIHDSMTAIIDSDNEMIDESYKTLCITKRSMYTFGLPRYHGKTSFAIERAKSNENITILCVRDFQTRQRITNEYDIGNALLVVPGVDFTRGIRYNLPITEIVIDDYEFVEPAFLKEMIQWCQQVNSIGFPDTEIKIIRVGTPIR